MNDTLKAIKKTGGNEPTLKAIALALNVPYPRLHGVAKQPQEGVVYDRNVFNWDAIDRFITRRLDAEKGFATVEEVIAKALEIDEQLKIEDGRRGLAKAKITLADGSEIIGRKYELAVGDSIILKKDEKKVPHKIVYTTVSHIVVQPEGGELLISMSNNTSNWKIAEVVKAQ